MTHAEEKSDDEAKTLKKHLSEKLSRLRPLENGFHEEESKWVINLSSKQLTEMEHSILKKGMKFAVAPGRLQKEHILAAVECGIQNLNEGEKSRIRVQTANILKFSHLPKSNISKDERNALCSLRNDKSRIVLSADKGNATVVMDESDYVNKMNILLEDREVYIELKKDPTRNTERKMNAMLLTSRKQGKFDYSLYNLLRSTDAICARLYGLPKIHKESVPLRPIVSFVGSPTYEVSKYLCSILSPLLGKSRSMVKNSFEFTSFVMQASHRPDDIMISFDVVSLFTNVPVNVAVELAHDLLSEDRSLNERTHLSVSEIINLIFE